MRNYPDNMTKEQAKQALTEGYEVRHHTFSSDESLHMLDGVLFDEVGNVLNITEFWAYRQHINFSNGWSIVK
jgi:predicted Zn-dependent protease